MKEWYALRSKPRREFFAASQLTRAGIEVYVPQIKVHRQHGKPSACEPFFPGYFFSHLDPQQAELHLAKYTPGVLYVVGYGDEPAPVPEALITSIQRRLDRSHGSGPLVDFRPGDRVVITSGPLQGLEAVFDCALSPTGRVRVLIQILQRVCRAELRASQLRRAGKVAGRAIA